MEESDKYQEDHNREVKRRLEDQKILFKGCTKAKVEGGSSLENPESPQLDEMYFVFNGKDERDPHSFMTTDQYFINGLVKSWDIKELDLVHAERDDELMVSSKYR